jgi:hypothetical protein
MSVVLLPGARVASRHNDPARRHLRVPPTSVHFLEAAVGACTARLHGGGADSAQRVAREDNIHLTKQTAGRRAVPNAAECVPKWAAVTAAVQISAWSRAVCGTASCELWANRRGPSSAPGTSRSARSPSEALPAVASPWRWRRRHP